MMMVILSALINRLRGWESGWERWHGKYPCALMMGCAWGRYGHDALVGIIVAIGYALWATRGWGDYMDFSLRRNDEVDWIDRLTCRLYQPWRDGCSMALRGLYALPMFAALSLYQLTFMPVLVGIMMVAQGVFYYVGWRYWPDMSGRATVLAEWLTGAWMGTLLWLVME